MHYISSVRDQKWSRRTKKFMYSRGYYAFKAPGVCTALWNDADWFKYVDYSGLWLVPWAAVKGELWRKCLLYYLNR